MTLNGEPSSTPTTPPSPPTCPTHVGFDNPNYKVNGS